MRERAGAGVVCVTELTLLTDWSVSYYTARIRGNQEARDVGRAVEHRPADQLRRSLPALGGGQLEGDRARLLAGPAGLGGALRHPAQIRHVGLLDVLLRRGRRDGRPLPVHRGGAEGGAEVLPRHAAGGRSPSRGLLLSLLQGG